MVGAGAGDEDAAGAKHLEGAEVEFFVAAEGGVEVALGFGEGGRIENDGVVVAVGGGVVLEQVEGVGLDPFDLLAFETGLVEGGVLVGDFEGGAGAVDAGDLGAAWSEMEGESSLIAEDVEGFAAGVVGGGGIVFALVEEGSGLLAFEGVIVELELVHGEGGGGFFALQQAGDARGKSFEFADAGVDALEDRGGSEMLGECGEDGFANGVGVHGLGEDLEGEDVAVAIDDEAGEKVGFAEDEAVGVGIVDYVLAVGDGVGDAVAQKCGEIRDWIGRDHADGDLRGTRVEGRAHGLAAMIGDA